MGRRISFPGTYWVCQILGWLSMVLIEMVNYTFFIIGKFSFSVLYMFIFCSAVGLVITHLYRYFIKRRAFFAATRTYVWVYAFVSTLAMSLVMTLLIETTVAILSKAGENNFTFIGVAGATVNWMRYVGVWVIIYFLYQILQQNTRIQQEKLQLENLAKTTELELLKSQLNPHFLFNALNSIKALVIINPEQSRDVIVKLSELLRFTLQYGKEKFILLKLELEEVSKYLDLEQLRFGNRLQVVYSVEDAALTRQVPPALLLTLVENAIKHGVARQMGVGSIEIRARLQTADCLNITVINSGKYEPQQTGGIGLKHLTRRLEELYGGHARFQIHQQQDQVHAELQLPIYEHSNPHR